MESKSTKKNIKHKMICPKCNGNGYMKKKTPIFSIWRWALTKHSVVQCKECKSEGEIEIDEQLGTGQYNPYALFDHIDRLH